MSVTYGTDLFVAVAQTGTGNRVMTSPDGITWTSRTSAADNSWYSVTYGNGLFVAVANSGTGNRVMTSPDGITWTSQNSTADNAWLSVTYGNNLFVAVAGNGTGRVMTSPDGITWTSRTSAANNSWYSVTYGNGRFVAVAQSGTGNRVMTSDNGIDWTSRTSAADDEWKSVAYGNNTFVAVAGAGTGSRVMTSPDGSTWTAQTSAANNSWISVTYGNGLFVAVANSGSGNRVMTSPDGVTWTSRTSAADNYWYSVAYGNNRFVAVAADGTGKRVMISPGPRASQTITVDQAAPASAAYGATFDVKAHAGSGHAVAVTTGGACSGGGSSSGTPGSPVTITMTAGTGTCSVYFNQAGNVSYDPAPQVVETTTAQKATPTATLNVTNSPVTYDGSPHAAAVGIAASSVPGAVSAILTGGSASQTAAGTYPVTATFTPTDTANYATLSGLSAGNFVISAPNNVSVTIQTNPSGQGITVDGTSYTAPQTFTWTASSSHSIAAPQYQNQVAGTRSAFASWSDGGAIGHTVTAPATGSATYTATFKTQYQLTINAGTGGTVLPASGNWYDAGMTPNIIATAASGYVFTSWNQTGGTGPILNPASTSTTVAMNGPNSVTATFQVPAVSITAAIGAKSGTTGGLRSWPITITNTGGATVTAAQLTGVLLSSSGTCKPAATTVFPISLGDIAPGNSAIGTVTVDFSTCNTPKQKALKFSVAVGYSANSGAATGTVGLSGVGQ
jgi:hypothetical protein